jgi:cation transport ATPase
MAESPKTSLSWLRWQTTLIAILSLVCIATYLTLRFTGLSAHPWPLWIALLVGGLPLVAGLLAKVIKMEFGADLLGGISIVVSIFLGEYLAGAIIVLMLSGGEALETYAMSNATSVLSALAKRLPTMAHRRGTDASAEMFW